MSEATAPLNMPDTCAWWLTEQATGLEGRLESAEGTDRKWMVSLAEVLRNLAGG